MHHSQRTSGEILDAPLPAPGQMVFRTPARPWADGTLAICQPLRRWCFVPSTPCNRPWADGVLSICQPLGRWRVGLFNPKDLKGLQKTPKDSKGPQKTMKDPRGPQKTQKTPKEPKGPQRTPKDSKRPQRLQKPPKHHLTSEETVWVTSYILLLVMYNC